MPAKVCSSSLERAERFRMRTAKIARRLQKSLDWKQQTERKKVNLRFCRLFRLPAALAVESQRDVTAVRSSPGCEDPIHSSAGDHMSRCFCCKKTQPVGTGPFYTLLSPCVGLLMTPARFMESLISPALPICRHLVRRQWLGMLFFPLENKRRKTELTQIKPNFRLLDCDSAACRSSPTLPECPH